MCGTLTCANDNSLCAECAGSLVTVPEPQCPGCGGPVDGILAQCSECLAAGVRPWRQAKAVFLYKGAARELILQLKFHRHTETAPLLAAYAAGVLNQFPDRFDYIVPVPLHWLRYLQRGYNQSSLVAAELSKLSGIPVLNALKRVKYGGHQARRKRQARLQAMRGSFKLRKNMDLSGKTVLLLDDVFTTGATLSAAAVALQFGHPQDIDVLSLGRRL